MMVLVKEEVVDLEVQEEEISDWVGKKELED